MLIALSFLMPTFYYIPKSVLAAVIIVAVYCMVEIEEIKPMWKGRSEENACLFTNPSAFSYYNFFLQELNWYHLLRVFSAVY